MADKASLIHVEIFGQTYAVKAGADAGYVEKLAGHVHAQMTEVSRTSGAVDSVRVAVLAALNIADECLRLREEAAKSGDNYSARAAALARELGAALGEP